MRLTSLGRFVLVIAVVGWAATGLAADKWGLQKGNPELKSAGPLAFGPDGILLVGDTKAATVFAIDTGDTSGAPAKVNVNIEGLKGKVAAALDSTPQAIAINDLAVNPLSGNAYLSVSRGRGPDAMPVLFRVDAAGTVTQVPLKDIPFAKATLPNPPEDKIVGRGRRSAHERSDQRSAYDSFDGTALRARADREPWLHRFRPPAGTAAVVRVQTQSVGGVMD